MNSVFSIVEIHIVLTLDTMAMTTAFDCWGISFVQDRMFEENENEPVELLEGIDLMKLEEGEIMELREDSKAGAQL